MDASTRSFHIYGKTETGVGALKAARGGISTVARRLLILIDGQRSVGELSEMLGMEAVELALAQLDSLGYVKFLRRFPGADEERQEFPESVADTERAGSRQTPVTIADPALPEPIASEPIVSKPVAPGLIAPRPIAPAKIASRPMSSDPIVSRRRFLAPALIVVLLAIVAALSIGVWRSANDTTTTEAAHATQQVDSAPAPARTPAREPSMAVAKAAQRASADALPGAVVGPVVPARPGLAAVPAVSGNLALRNSMPAHDAAPDITGAPPVPAPVAAATRSLHVRSQLTPEIPKAVRDRGITSGHVVVVLHVNPQGTVEHVELVSASPPDVYDKDMEQAFGGWTFDPLGIPGRMTVDVDIRPPQ
jgi:protein TonB